MGQPDVRNVSNCDYDGEADEYRRDGASGSGSHPFWLTDESHPPRLRTTSVIGREFVGNTIANCRSLRPNREGRYVKENLRASAIGRDEAEATIIVPLADSALKAHAVLSALTNQLTGDHRGAKRVTQRQPTAKQYGVREDYR